MFLTPPRGSLFFNHITHGGHTAFRTYIFPSNGFKVQKRLNSLVYLYSSLFQLQTPGRFPVFHAVIQDVTVQILCHVHYRFDCVGMVPHKRCTESCLLIFLPHAHLPSKLIEQFQMSILKYCTILQAFCQRWHVRFHPGDKRYHTRRMHPLQLHVYPFYLILTDGQVHPYPLTDILSLNIYSHLTSPNKKRPP